jgi:hypothetical protein
VRDEQRKSALKMCPSYSLPAPSDTETFVPASVSVAVVTTSMQLSTAQKCAYDMAAGIDCS